MKINERMYQGVIGVLVIIILFLVWWTSAHPGSGVTGGTATDTEKTATSNSLGGSISATQTTSPTTEASGEFVSIADQPAGTEVSVSQLNLSQPGWVAVRDSGGRTLGAAWFDAGTQTHVSVPLLRGTESGQSYQALLYADDGDHQFDLHTDALITNSDGSVAGTTFSAQ